MLTFFWLPVAEVDFRGCGQQIEMMGCISVCCSVLQYLTVNFCTDLGTAQLLHSVFSLFRFHFLLQVAAVDFRGCGQKRSMMACVAVCCSVLQCVAVCSTEFLQ